MKSTGMILTNFKNNMMLTNLKSTTGFKLLNFKLLSFKLLFTIAVTVLVPIVLTLAGCKAEKHTPNGKSSSKTGVGKTLTDTEILAKYFAHKKYTGDTAGTTKQYTIDDIIAPKKIISALTNTKISYIKLLRNEILARRGYSFKSTDLQEILQTAKWYTKDTNFILADLTKIEIGNVSFLKKLEKIDLIGGERARQLAVVLDMDKHNINTDEAIKVYKAAKKADVLTTLDESTLLHKEKGETIYEEFKNAPDADIYFHFMRENARFLVGFKKNQRLLSEIGGNNLLIECIIKMTNIKWAYIAEPQGETARAVPDLKIHSIVNGKVVLTNNPKRLFVTHQMRENMRPFILPSKRDYRPYIVYKEKRIIPVGFESIESSFGFENEEHNRYYSWVKKDGDDLYVLIPFWIKKGGAQGNYGRLDQMQDIIKSAQENKFLSGVKIFKITILN